MFHTVHALNVLISPHVQSAQPSPYILWKSRITRRLSANSPPRHCTCPRGSAPLANASGVVWNLAITRNRVRTHAIRSLVHTPLVIGKVRFTWLLCVNFCANAPSTVAKIVNKLTVPTVGMSVCESFYRKSESSDEFNPGPPIISQSMKFGSRWREALANAINSRVQPLSLHARAAAGAAINALLR
jgi:hypothetical protein